MPLSRVPKKLEHFLLFPLLHHSLTDHIVKGRGRTSRVFSCQERLVRTEGVLFRPKTFRNFLIESYYEQSTISYFLA
ncbi:MAG: hypothetical protein K0R47_2208 [Brevibacillus sp.]|nr:hypothetical protein [Brevibacillus sp.]